MTQKEDFQKKLDEIFAWAEKFRLEAVVIRSGDLHALVGNYPGKDHRMPICCEVMKKNMGVKDKIIESPPSGKGANLIIIYYREK